MESLKSSVEVCEPDPRNLYFAVIDGEGIARRMALEDIYKHVSSITLHEGVPEDIRSHFAQAQNLALYSWFYYPFNVTAQLMGFVSVEFALKRKSGSKANLRSLIDKAIAEGWIRDDGFAIAKLRENPEGSYVEVLSDVIPHLRNSLAHGSTMLHNNALSSLRICAEFINQLFDSNGR
jgi:hypothetical protein